MYEIKYKQVEQEDLKADTAEVSHGARKKQTGQETALGATLRKDEIEQYQQCKRPEADKLRQAGLWSRPKSSSKASWKGEGEKRNQSIDWYCERYGANIEEFRKWLQGINHSVKEVQVVGRPGQPEAPKQEAEAAEEAMSRLTAWASNSFESFS